jgi:hypothetical protein
MSAALTDVAGGFGRIALPRTPFRSAKAGADKNPLQLPSISPARSPTVCPSSVRPNEKT